MRPSAGWRWCWTSARKASECCGLMERRITRVTRVAEWLEENQRLRVINFPAYTPEENPKEATWKTLKEEVSHHCWHETFADLSKAIDGFYQTARKHTVSFLEKFGYCWSGGRIHPLPQT